MALQDLLNLSQNGGRNKIGISEERIEAIKPVLRQYIALWREYPDLFVDFMQTGGDPNKKLTFKLFFYQRVFLRVAIRYKYVYAVYPRAYSKSFLSVMILMIRAILYPGAHLFTTAGGKEQAAAILYEKVNEICQKIPAFRREIDWSRGKTREGKDHCLYVFKNTSNFENVAARESSRGRRKHGGLIEECVGVDQKILQEVLIPRFWGPMARAIGANRVNLWKKGVRESVLTGKKKNPVPSFILNKEGVETIGDECSRVGWSLPPPQAPDNYFLDKTN